MNSNLLFAFLKRHIKEPKSLLLGFSGGPDSLALLHMLLELRDNLSKKNIPLKIALAHVDHGWRKESADEAYEIHSMAERLRVDLHFKKLDMSQLLGNLEKACRIKRLEFFSESCSLNQYDALLLGHHADDLAETVLKRIFEGAAFTGLGSMQEALIYGKMKVLRPLLKMTKKEILKWLDERKLVGFHDKTNDDISFLRARMRKKTFPYLEEVFGKEIGKSLRLLSEESIEFKEHLDQKILPVLTTAIKGPWGLYLDLQPMILEKKFSKFELKYLIKRFAEMARMLLSRENLIVAAEFLMKKDANKRLISGGKNAQKVLIIDRMRLFLSAKPFLKFSEESCAIIPGSSVNFNGWQIHMSRIKANVAVSISQNFSMDWNYVWQGTGKAILPMRDYMIAPPSPSLLFDNKNISLDKHWTSLKVPAFLRNMAPVILKEGKIVHDFLSGSKKPLDQSAQEFCLLELTYKGQ